MKYTCHVPVEQYGFIEVEVEGEPTDAVIAYNNLKEAFAGGPGIGTKELARVLHEYCTTGAIAMGGNLEYSLGESLLISEVTKLLRKAKR